MVKDFEGRSEKEAIAKAMVELQLDDGDFEVEILSEEDKGFGFFKKHSVRIRVHYGEDRICEVPCDELGITLEEGHILMSKGTQFLEKIISLMGYESRINSQFLKGQLVFDIESESSAILIGRQGKNLDALQLILSIYVGRLVSKLENFKNSPRVVVDSKDYRHRREESIVREALRNAEQVVRTKSSCLLNPMSAFERRLIHTTLSEKHDIITQSEGEGDTRQVRIIYKGSR